MSVSRCVECLSFRPVLCRIATLVWTVVIGGILVQDCSAQSCGNPVACENQLPGSDGWQIDDGAGDLTIQGFATDISVNVGGTISFKVNTNAKAYALNIYRIGYYGGSGARQVATVSPSVSLPQTQPACLADATTNLLDCGNWSVSASWQVPSSAVSGLYVVDLVRSDTGGTSQMFFVVRNDTSHSDILYSTSDETWQAYNDYGGHSLYGSAGVFDLFNRAFKVSYNRPYDTRAFEDWTFLFNAEYPMIRWLESNGYDVSYFTNVDEVRNSGLITNHKLLLSTGHDEYVSAPRRKNIEAARDAGVNLAFFSGNEVFWKTRWENSTDGSNTPYRTLVCYKETYYGTNQGTYQADPLDPPTWTGTWRDTRFSPPADGGRPENSLTGTIFMVNGPGDDNSYLSISVPAADGKMRFWRNTSIATQSAGQVATLPSGTLGYEWDGDVDNGFRPAGLIPLSTSTFPLTEDLLLDYGAIYGGGSMTHHLTLYRAPSGALVFGGGTVQWSWGLDDNHDEGDEPVDSRMQQATVNLFADMGVQPTTLQPGLLPATQSTDHTPPTSAITSPAPGTTVPYGTKTTVTGTATDSGGGVIGAVEVSVDGGQTWHPATGRESWTYTWSPPRSGSATLQVRAVDDSGNLQNPVTSAAFAVSGVPTCPCWIWSSSNVPAKPSELDTSQVEVGLKFRSDMPGLVTGIRFYKGANNTGTHVGHLWSAQGANLATVTFTNETATGWQQANFSTSIPIAANTTYIVSYYAPNGGYADDEPYFWGASVDTPPLHAIADGVDGGNGLYVYASGGGYPTYTYNSANYWVDLVFMPSSTWSISGTITGGGGDTVTLSGTSTATVTANSSGSYTFANLVNGSYTVTPSAIGFAFTPPNQAVTINGASVTGVNFVANSVPTYSLSGSTGVSGATVTLSGGSATVAANPSGNYTFPNLINGTYTVTPSQPAYTFSPVNRAVTVNGANVTGVNFTPTALPTWSISGTVTGASNVTVVLSGAGTGTVTTNATGAYAFTGLLNGTYTITPTVTGYSFTPASQNMAINGANIAGVNFTATQAASIWNNSATAANPSEADSSPVELGLKFTSDVAGVVTGVRFYKGSFNTGKHVGHLWTTTGTNLGTVTFTGETASGWQQANFSPSVAISANTTYIISYYAPSGGYAADVNFFATAGVNNPPLHALPNSVTGGNGVYVYATGGGFPSSTYQSTNYWVDLVFASSLWSISGTITGGGGATVSLSGTASATTTADSSGNYTFSDLANGSYTITPSGTGSVFNPASRAVTVNSANLTGVNFAVAPYSMSGSAGVGSATLTLSGTASATTTADSSGNYTFTNLPNGSYTVTPSKTGYSFSPTNQTVSVNGANVTGVNFTATVVVVSTYSISGVTGLAGATVQLSGTASATSTADSSGNYTFTNVVNGSYTVTPSTTGFVFTPASKAVTVSGANVTGVNFTATGAISIDVTTSQNQSTASTTVATSKFSTTSAGELLLAFVSADAISTPNVAVSAISTTGITWALVERINTQKGTAEIWRAFATSTLVNVTATLTLSQKVTSSLTVMTFKGVDPSGTNGSGAIGAVAGGNAASGAPTAHLVTTRNNSLVIGVGDDWDNATARTLGSGQTMVNQYLAPSGDTFWVQRQTSVSPLSGTTVTVNDTAPTADRYNLSICEILAAP